MNNCLLAALTAKMRHPYNTMIHQCGSWFEILHCRWPHFYWEYNGRYYHYSQKDQLTWFGQLWYDGEIVEMMGKDV